MKKKDIELIFKGADEQSFQELLDDLRPKGEWLLNEKTKNNTHPTCRCSNCGLGIYNYSRTDFCPNCGADMRGTKDEKNS